MSYDVINFDTSLKKKITYQNSKTEPFHQILTHTFHFSLYSIFTIPAASFTYYLLWIFFIFLFFFIDTSCCCRRSPPRLQLQSRHLLCPPLHPIASPPWPIPFTIPWNPSTVRPPIAPPHHRETHRNHHGTNTKPPWWLLHLLIP